MIKKCALFILLHALKRTDHVKCFNKINFDVLFCNLKKFESKLRIFGFITVKNLKLFETFDYLFIIIST